MMWDIAAQLFAVIPNVPLSMQLFNTIIDDTGNYCIVLDGSAIFAGRGAIRIVIVLRTWIH
jgi:hypothetical protein